MSTKSCNCRSSSLGIARRYTTHAHYAWVIVWVVFLASVAAPLNQFKVPPLLPVLVETFDIELGQAALLMSSFAITGVICALPAGLVLQRLGLKTTGIIALLSLIIGSGLGAVVDRAGWLMATRVLEGIGMGLISLVGPSAITLWFRREKQGLPMGIWATWVGVGSFIMYNLAPQLEHSFGWQSVWWTGSGLAVIALLLFIVFMRLPADACIRCEDSSIRSIEPDQLQFAAVLGNRDIWLLGLEFGCFNITFTGFLTYFPTFLSDVRDFSLSHASFVASLVTLAGLVSAPLSGLLSDRIGSRRLLITVPFLLIAGLWVFPFQVTEWALYAFVVALGVLSLAIATATFAAVPEVIASPNQTGMGLAVIALFANIGILTGPLLVGKMVETVGWVFTGYWLIPICVFGALVARAIKVR